MNDAERSRQYLKTFYIRYPIMLTAYLGSIYWIATNSEKVGLWLPAASMTLAILGDILDHKTTEILVAMGGIELNPNFPPKPTPEDLYNNNQKALGGIIIAISGLFPPFGIARAADKFYTGLDNTKKIIIAKYH